MRLRKQPANTGLKLAQLGVVRLNCEVWSHGHSFRNAKFRYTAIDAEGNQKTGRVSAGSEEQAQEKLETLGYFVQELSVETRGAKASRTKDIRRRSQDFRRC